jgi:hypothetical protein
MRMLWAHTKPFLAMAPRTMRPTTDRYRP